jgi:sarcosine/dimethylglycine N-methyltransferase
VATVAEHYERSEALAKVGAALDRMAPDGRVIGLEELAGFDHFHTAGILATERMATLLAPTPADVVLDAGSGVGGPTRYLAARFGCRVVGVDLTPLFVDVGQLLSVRTEFDRLVDLKVGDVTEMELETESIDHVWTQHVAMNIADRPKLYAEIRRVMKPGGRFVLFDVIDGGGGDLLLPVPWATEPHHSFLVTRGALRALVEAAGFRVDVDDDPGPELLPAMQRMLQASPPAVGLTTAMLIDDVETKGPRYLQNLAEGRTALALMSCTAV